MKAQTAVDFIIEKLAENGVLHSADIWMAKSIEKSQIMNAWVDGALDTNAYINFAEQYYNETFNK